MNRWTTLAMQYLDKTGNPDNVGNPPKNESPLTKYITEHTEVTDELIGFYFLRAYYRVSIDDISGGMDDHTAAWGMIKSLSGKDAYYIAGDAMDAGLPPDYCASLFMLSIELMLAHNESVAESPDDDTDYVPLRTIASAYNKQGLCYYNASNPVAQEKACYESALAILDSDPDPDIKLKGMVKSNLAECFAREENYDKAIELYCETCDIFEPIAANDAVAADQLALSLRSISDIYRATGENVMAHTYLSMAIDTLEKHPNGASEDILAQLSSCYNSRGTLRFHMGDYPGEVDDCTVAIRLRDTLPTDISALSTMYTNRAEAYANHGKYEEAIKDYERTIEVLMNADESFPEAPHIIALRYFGMAECHRLMNNPRIAIEIFLECAQKLSVLDTSNIPESYQYQILEAESLSRMWAARIAVEEPVSNYHLAIEQANLALDMMYEFEPVPNVIFNISSLHALLGNVYEIFDENERAREQYRLSEEILEHMVAYSDAEEDEEVDEESDIWEDSSDTIPQA